MPTQKQILDMLRLITRYDAGCPKVRIGLPSDGGYVINDDFDGVDGVISIGINDEVGFDAHFANNGVKICQYDHTVDGPPDPHPNYKFRKVAWGINQSEGERTLSGMIEENGLSNCNNMILKFDAEGAEWPCLGTTDANVLNKFRIITGEFHDFSKIGSDNFFEIVNHVLRKLSFTHMVTHIHANNCASICAIKNIAIPDCLEISFLRKDRSSFSISHDPIPSDLDYPNHPDYPDIVMTPFGS